MCACVFGSNTSVLLLRSVASYRGLTMSSHRCSSNQLITHLISSSSEEVEIISLQNTPFAPIVRYNSEFKCDSNAAILLRFCNRVRNHLLAPRCMTNQLGSANINEDCVNLTCQITFNEQPGVHLCECFVHACTHKRMVSQIRLNTCHISGQYFLTTCTIPFMQFPRAQHPQSYGLHVR